LHNKLPRRTAPVWPPAALVPASHCPQRLLHSGGVQGMPAIAPPYPCPHGLAIKKANHLGSLPCPCHLNYNDMTARTRLGILIIDDMPVCVPLHACMRALPALGRFDCRWGSCWNEVCVCLRSADPCHVRACCHPWPRPIGYVAARASGFLCYYCLFFKTS
jgi:hypothetical protein